MFGKRVHRRSLAKSILLLASVALLWFSSAVYGVIHSGNLTQDETWANTDVHIVTGTFTVEPGVTLTISSGANVKFESGAMLEVHGALDVQGAVGNEVVFTSNEVAPALGDWGGIQVNAGAGTVTIDQAVVEYSQEGIYFNQSGAVGLVTNSVLQHNGKGVHVAGAASPTIGNGNEITQNSYGVYARGLGSAGNNPSLVVTGNSVHANSSYNYFCALNTFHDPVNVRLDATGNWWGATDPGVIAQGIFDATDNTSLPTVDVDGYLGGPGGGAVTNLMTFHLAPEGTFPFDANYQEDGITVVSKSDFSSFGDPLLAAPTTSLYFHGTDQYVEFSMVDGGVFDLLSFELVTNGFADRWIETSKSAGIISIGQPQQLTPITFTGPEYTGISWFRVGTPWYATQVDNIAVSAAPTPTVIHSGNLAQDETWANTDVHVVTGAFSVEPGVTLTISASTTVKFESGATLEIYGALDVQGSAGNQVVFTSSAAVPAAGDWGGIWIREGASTVTIDHALIEYANYGLFFNRTGSVGVVTNSEIRNNNWGVYLANTSGVAGVNPLPVITGNSLYGNTHNVHAAAYFDHENVRVDASGNWWGSVDPVVIEQGIYDYIDASISNSPTVALDSYLDGPGGNAVAGLSGSYGSDTTLSPGTVYTVLGPITVPPGATLTIPSGVELRFPKQSSWIMEVFGSLLVQGAAGSEVVFTSSAAVPAAGDWGGIWIREGASTVTIDHALIEYANYGLFFNRTGSVGVVTNSEIRNNNWGVYLANTSGVAGVNPLPVITGNSLYGNTHNVHAAAYFDHENVRVDASGNWWGSVDPVVIEQGIYDYIDASISNSPTVALDSYLDGPGGNAVAGLSGSYGSDTTLSPGTVYTVLGPITVPPGATLTIPSGVELRFPKQSSWIMEVFGSLLVQGAAGSEVVFTSSAAVPAAGDWGGIWIREGASTVTIDHALIEYANYGLFFNRTGSVGVVTNSEIRNNTRGVYLWAATVAGVNPLPVITGNSLYGNTYNVYAAAYFDHENVRVDASGNWWGSVDPVVIEQGIYDYIDASISNSPTVALDSYLDGPGGNAVAGLSGSYGSDTTLSPGTVYTVLGPITVPPGATLTIPSGVELRFPKQSSWIMEVFGSLLVQGAAGSEVVFTSSAAVPAAGDWGGIWIREGASTVTIDHALIEYANYGLFFNRTGSVGVVTNSEIRNNTRGVYLWAATVAGVNPLPVITGNSLYGNTYNVYAAAYFDHENVRVDASGNWWGSVDPVVIEQGIYDYIDKPSSSPTVDFSAYLGGPGGAAVTNIMTFNSAPEGAFPFGAAYHEDGITVVSNSDFSLFGDQFLVSPTTALYFHGTDQYVEFRMSNGSAFDLLGFEFITNGFADRWIETSKSAGTISIGQPQQVTPITFAGPEYTDISWFRIGTPWYSTQVDNIAVSAIPVVDNQGPEITGVTFDTAPLIDGQVITRSGTFGATAIDTSGMSRVEFFIDGVLLATDTSGFNGYQAEWSITDVTDGAHTVAVTAYDTRENATTDTRNVTVALAPPPAPAITEPSTGLQTNLATITVAGTAEPGSEVLLYQNTAQVGGVVVTSAAGTFTTSLALVEGENRIQAAAQNRGGTGPLSAEVVVTRDSSIPDAPVGLITEPRPNGAIRLLWSAPNDETVTGYDVYRANQSFSTLAQAQKLNSQTLTALAYDDLPPADGRYFYRAVSVNAVGTPSDLSNEASAASDATLPRAVSISYLHNGNHELATGRMGVGQVDVTVTVSEPLLATPFMSLTPNQGLPISLDLGKITDLEYQGSFSITDTTPSGTAYVAFSARDRVGNRGTSVDAGGSILIDTQGPVVVSLATAPADPIQNDQTVPVDVQIDIDLDAPLPLGQEPELSYLLSGAGRTPVTLPPLTKVGAQTYQGSFTLPADAGLAEVEILQLSFLALDDLANAGTEIQGNSGLQVYQGDLPPLQVPTGLTAQALPGGQVNLSWNPVEGATVYQLYRQGPGEVDLIEHQRVTQSTGFLDTTSQDGLYRYTVASVRQANDQEALSAQSDPVEVTTDSVMPTPPTNFSAVLVGAGIQTSWQAPAGETSLTYSLYRSGAEIMSVAGLTPIQTGVTALTALDGSPSETEPHYAVTAVDASGNESLPSNSFYLNADLLPVSNLKVMRQDLDPPVVSWSQNGSTVAGFNVYIDSNGESLLVNGALLTQPTYTDTGYAVGDRQYQVTAVDGNSVESIKRGVLLPAVQVTLAEEARVLRGVMNRLEYTITNESAQSLDDVQIRSRISTYEHVSDTVSLAPGETRTVPVVVGGYPDLPDLSALTTTIQVAQSTGELAEIVRSGEIMVGDGALALGILTEAFTRGGAGTVRFRLENTSGVELELVTALDNGSKPSDEILVRLIDGDGNVLSDVPFEQILGTDIVTLSNGKSVARIPAGATFTSAPAVLPVPSSAPDDVTVELLVNHFHYHLTRSDAITIPGLSTRQAVTLVDVSYTCDVQSISPAGSFGDEEVMITGSAIDRDTGLPLPSAPVKLVLNNAGFERTYDIFTDATGNFTYAFQPLSGESGIYTVSCIHPDILERPEQGQFTVSRLLLTPTNVTLNQPINFDRTIPFKIVAGQGTQATNVRLVYEAQDQPLGSLPAGINVVLSDPVAVNAGETLSIPVTFSGDATAGPSGTVVLKLKSNEGADKALAEAHIDYQFSAAEPALFYSPSFIETGAAYDESVSETLTVENRGLADLENVSVALLHPDDTPVTENWIFLTSEPDLGTLAIGDVRPVHLRVAPTNGVPEGIYEYRLRISSTNHPSRDVGVFVSVVQDGIGNVLFKVEDIYTATLDTNGDIVQGLAGARIRLQNEKVPSIDQTMTTDTVGEVLFFDLPSGWYKYRVSASNHQEFVGRLQLRPGVTTSQEVFLDYNLVTVEWSVTEITLQDRYEITLNATFETDVPAPVVIAEPLSVNLPEMKPGDVYNGEFTLTNYGLVRADNLKVILPSGDQYFQFEVLAGLPDSLDAKERITIPYRLTSLRSLDPDAAGDATGGGCYSYIEYITAIFLYICANDEERSGSALHSLYSSGGSDCGTPGETGPTGNVDYYYTGDDQAFKYYSTPSYSWIGGVVCPPDCEGDCCPGAGGTGNGPGSQ